MEALLWETFVQIVGNPGRIQLEIPMIDAPVGRFAEMKLMQQLAFDVPRREGHRLSLPKAVADSRRGVRTGPG